MTAKEFIEKEGLEYSLAEYDEGGFSGINERLLEQKLEEYHQAKLKKSRLGDVVSSEAELPKCKHTWVKSVAYKNARFCSKCAMYKRGYYE